MKVTSKSLTTVTLEQLTDLTLQDLCNTCQVTPEFIEQIIEYNIITPIGQADARRFTSVHLKRVRMLLRLQQDLEINLPAGALVIDLMEELDQLRTRIAILEQYFHTT